MKAFFLLISLSFSPFVWSYEKVESLSGGSCWFALDEGAVKVASFADGKSARLGSSHFDDFFSQLLLDRPDFNPSAVEGFVHCGGYGSRVVFNVNSEGRQFCLWADYNSQKLTLTQFSQAASSGTCQGYKDLLLVGVIDKEKMSSDDFLKEMSLSPFYHNVEDINFLNASTFSLTLKEDLRYQEKEMKKRIEDYFLPKKVLKGIDLDFYLHPVGEFKQFK